MEGAPCMQLRKGGSEKKKGEEDKKGKPSSKLAAKLREEQERRALEERAAQISADLTEEATRLFKSIDVLGLGEKALKKLDSRLFKQVVKVVGGHDGHHHIRVAPVTTVDAPIAERLLRPWSIIYAELFGR